MPTKMAVRPLKVPDYFFLNNKIFKKENCIQDVKATGRAEVPGD